MYGYNQDNLDKVPGRTAPGGVTINGFLSHNLEKQLATGGSARSDDRSAGHMQLRMRQVACLTLVGGRRYAPARIASRFLCLFLP